MTDEGNCCIVEPKVHLAAYLENRELMRDLDDFTCNSSLLEKISCNYIIVKKILSHLSWQDKLLCKSVCKMWRDAVNSLQRELLGPQDFVFEFDDEINHAILKSSGNFTVEPMVVLTFTTFSGFCKMGNCGTISPSPCQPSCGAVHWLLDCMEQELCYPKECNLILRASYLSYMPLPRSVTFKHTIYNDMLAQTTPLICGMYIPKLPEVEYKVISIKSNSDIQTDFYDVVDKIAETRIFKGFIIFVTDKYLLNSLQDLVFLNHLKVIQPDVPYALGGCIIEDAVSDKKDLYYFINNVNKKELRDSGLISENVVSITMFSVPKEPHLCTGISNFEMYSLVIESSEWSKPKIQKAVKEFSENITQHEHSLVFKFSCVGRDEKHEFEMYTFRSSFPNTPLIGCYGNGELGLNHPPRTEVPPNRNTVRRLKQEVAQFGIMYSYATIFVYLGWGKAI